MNIVDRFSDSCFAHFHNHATLFAGALLLGISLAAQADDMQDAHKLFKQGMHSQALGKLNNYLAAKPNDAQARFLKGLILTEQGEITEAIITFTALTKDYPELPEPYNNLAVLYASQGQYDNAKLALEMAIRTHPSYATAHENLGDIYAKMASQAYDRALQLDRGNTATQTKLAMIQELFAGGARGKAGDATPAISAGINPEATVTAPAEPVPAAVTDSSSEVLNTVKAWAAAWSSQNASSYLSFYAEDFKTPSGEPRAAWEAFRRERVGAPRSISVGISNPAVTFSDSDHATVKFRQSYRANGRTISNNKTLLMARTDGKWLIQEEHSR